MEETPAKVEVSVHSLTTQHAHIDGPSDKDKQALAAAEKAQADKLVAMEADAKAHAEQEKKAAAEKAEHEAKHAAEKAEHEAKHAAEKAEAERLAAQKAAEEEQERMDALMREADENTRAE